MKMPLAILALVGVALLAFELFAPPPGPDALQPRTDRTLRIRTMQAGMKALPVETRRLELQDDYTMRRTFSGTVHARRASVVGFEQGGRLARVLVDEGAILRGVIDDQVDHRSQAVILGGREDRRDIVDRLGLSRRTDDRIEPAEVLDRVNAP